MSAHAKQESRSHSRCPAFLETAPSAVIRFLFADAVRAIPARRIFLPACIPLRPCASAYQAHCALRVLARFAGEKTKGETAAQCRPAERERERRRFLPRNDRPQDLREALQIEKLQRNKAGLERRPFVPARQGISSLQGVFFLLPDRNSPDRAGGEPGRGVLFTGSGGSFCLWSRRCRGRAFCPGEVGAQASSPCSLRDKGHGVWSGRPARGMRW